MAMSGTAVFGSKNAHHHFFAKRGGQRSTREFPLRAPRDSILMRPSCGLRFSEMSMREIIFNREMTAGAPWRGACEPCGSTPSMPQPHQRLIALGAP